MVLESLINPFKAEKKPWEMFFIGFAYSSVAILLSMWIFKQHASLVMVFLTVMACIPLIYSTIKLEEEKDLIIKKEKILLKEHGRALSFFIFLFFGITISFTLWYTLLPQSAAQSLFSIQAQTIADINNQITGNQINPTMLFTKIFLNNMKVLVFCILFAFVYGAGAIFILTWNASVIAAAIGNFIRANLNSTHLFHGYFQIASVGILRYSIHGIPEMLAYFTAGLAGGIISIAVIKHDFGSKKFTHILTDSADLLIISVAILLVAALIEVYITPVLF